MKDLFTDLNEPTLPFLVPNSKDYSVKWNRQLDLHEITIPNGKLYYAEHFFDKIFSDRTVEYFLENDSNLDLKKTNWRSLDKDQLDTVMFKNIKWHHDKIKIYGKEVFLPRYSAWYGDNDKPYTYSGLTLRPKSWNEGLLCIKNKIDKIAGVQFNSVLLNWYRDGEDHISWHTDAEKSLGKNPTIGSVNFGATRKFQLRRINNENEKLEIPLKHGTLLVMEGEIQHFWQHAVPKEKQIKDSRFNLTFRVIYS